MTTLETFMCIILLITLGLLLGSLSRKIIESPTEKYKENKSRHQGPKVKRKTNLFGKRNKMPKY